MTTKKNTPQTVGRTGIAPTLGYRQVQTEYGNPICAKDSGDIRPAAPRNGAAIDRRKSGTRHTHGLAKAYGAIANKRHDSGGVYGREQEENDNNCITAIIK